MKKNTSRPTTLRTPATSETEAAPAAAKKSAGTSPSKAAAKSTKATRRNAPTAVATPPAPTPKVSPVKAPEKQPVATTILAKIDVGFGNTLFLRGEGPGLSWGAGIPMECVEDTLWKMVLGESERGFTFKFLLNDTTWSVGTDFSIGSGESVVFEPTF